MAESLCNEIKRLHKRKQLPITSSALERMQDSESSGSEMGPESPRRPDSPPNLMRHGEKALFTFKQVQLICESMIKERENQLRERYESVLTTKLAAILISTRIYRLTTFKLKLGRECACVCASGVVAQ